MNIYNNGINPSLVQKLQQNKPANKVYNDNENSASSFSEVLNKTLTSKLNDSHNSVEFSKHAQLRLNARNITFSETQMSRIEKGMEQAREKGIKDSLMLVDNVALIVNIKNNVVVTAVEDSKDKIFTNIDGAVIV